MVNVHFFDLLKNRNKYYFVRKKKQICDDDFSALNKTNKLVKGSNTFLGLLQLLKSDRTVKVKTNYNCVYMCVMMLCKRKDIFKYCVSNYELYCKQRIPFFVVYT